MFAFVLIMSLSCKNVIGWDDYRMNYGDTQWWMGFEGQLMGVGYRGCAIGNRLSGMGYREGLWETGYGGQALKDGLWGRGNEGTGC